MPYAYYGGEINGIASAFLREQVEPQLYVNGLDSKRNLIGYHCALLDQNLYTSESCGFHRNTAIANVKATVLSRQKACLSFHFSTPKPA